MNRLLLLGFVLLFNTGCDPQSQGFKLPPGNVEDGRAAFILLQCNNCHSVADSVPWSPDPQSSPIHVALGGPTTLVRTYGDLVTSVIHPTAKNSRGLRPDTVTDEQKSKMRNYNDVMSVQEMIDIVEYLKSEYELLVPELYSSHP